MSRNKLGLMRALHKLHQAEPKEPVQDLPVQGVFKRSFVMSVVAVVAIGGKPANK